MEQVVHQSRLFWSALEKSDTAAMRSVCDPGCFFVHIGGNADLNREMEGFEKKIFQPTEITIHGQEVKSFGDIAVVISDVDYIYSPDYSQEAITLFGSDETNL